LAGAANATSKYIQLPREVAATLNESQFDALIGGIVGTPIAYGSRGSEAAARIAHWYKTHANYSFNFYLNAYMQVSSGDVICE
jgi:hypothetical protein